jgi:hypothetical protein
MLACPHRLQHPSTMAFSYCSRGRWYWFQHSRHVWKVATRHPYLEFSFFLVQRFHAKVRNILWALGFYCAKYKRIIRGDCSQQLQNIESTLFWMYQLTKNNEDDLVFNVLAERRTFNSTWVRLHLLDMEHLGNITRWSWHIGSTWTIVPLFHGTFKNNWTSMYSLRKKHHGST